MTNARILLLAAFVTVSALGLLLWINRVLERRRAALQRRLQGSKTESEPEMNLDAALAARPRGWMSRLDSGFESMIRHTGVDVEPDQALALIALAAVGLAAILFLWRQELWLSVLGMIAGGVGTLVVFFVLRNRHRRQLSEQLPDAFYLLARSLRAGLSLEQAIALTGEQGAKPLAGEFQLCAAQLRLGLAVPAALEVVARRIRLLDFNVFVSTVSLHHVMGGNLAMLLDRLAASTRDRTHFRNYFKTATALSRVTAVFIGIMSPVLLLAYAIFQPDFSRPFFESPTGWTALAIAGVLQVVGIVWLYRLLRVEY
jgi:tight adherence protein B